MVHFHKTAGQFYQPLQHIQHLIFSMLDTDTDNRTGNIKIQHYGYPNQLFQIKVQSRMPGQGRRREDWPTGREEEGRHALNIGKE